MNDLFTTLFYFYLLIFLGYLFGRAFKQKNKQIRKAFSFILLFILAPPLIILAFILPNFSLTPQVIIYIIFFKILLVITTQVLVYFIFLRKRAKDENKRIASMLMLVAFPNSMLFPLPIVLSIFGTDYVVIIVVFALTAMVIRGTWITYLCIRYSENKSQDYRGNIIRLLTFPPTIAIIISAFLVSFNVTVTSELFIITNDILSLLTTIFGAMLIGILLVNLNFQNIAGFKKDFLIVVGIRVIFSFCLFFILIQFFIFPIEIKTQTLTILLMIFVDPPAVTNTTYAEHFDLDKDFTAFCVITLTILAIIYIPLILILGMIIF